MNLINLDKLTREFMMIEVDMDIEEDRLYFSKRFTSRGRKDYPTLLHQSVKEYDAIWLADQLNKEGRMSGAELSHSRKGTQFIKRTPLGDHETFAFGEYNRFYVRGLCARAIEEGIEGVDFVREIKLFTVTHEFDSFGNSIKRKEIIHKSDIQLKPWEMVISGEHEVDLVVTDQMKKK